jgi:hypothetical protein
MKNNLLAAGNNRNVQCVTKTRVYLHRAISFHGKQDEHQSKMDLKVHKGAQDAKMDI